MNVDLILSLLQNSLNTPIDSHLLSETTCKPIRAIKQNILALTETGLVTSIDGKNIELSVKQRLRLAILALREGADIERVCKALGWKEFEDLVALALEHNEYEVIKHLRIKSLGKRYEVDVVGIKEPYVLSIECKHWKKSWKRAAVINAVKTQIARTRALTRILPEPKDRLGVAKWREAKIIPLVLTLSSTPLKTYENVPIVPIFYFNSFLNAMQTHMQAFMTLFIKNLKDPFEPKLVSTKQNSNSMAIRFPNFTQEQKLKHAS